MNHQQKYLFQSTRLGFRNWLERDLEPMSIINQDPRVMEFFPSLKAKGETADFIERMQKQFLETGMCYFATELLDTGEFAGFIGLGEQTFNSPFTPCIDIGWRLKHSLWGKGLATEGARRCLEYGFTTLGLKKINAIAPKVNLPSISIMSKLGMIKTNEFKHPLLSSSPHIEDCVLYETQTSR